MAMNLTINGNSAPAPTSFEVILNSLQKSAERNANGTLTRETLPDKWTLNCEWEFGTPAEFYAWYNILKALTRIYFTISFPAPTGNTETATFYIAPISAKMIQFTGTSGWWKPLKTSFVEV